MCGVCFGLFHLITGLNMLTFSSWGNTPSCVGLHGLLVGQLLLRLLPYEEKLIVGIILLLSSIWHTKSPVSEVTPPVAILVSMGLLS